MTVVEELREAVSEALRTGRPVANLAQLLDDACEHEEALRRIRAEARSSGDASRRRETQRELALRTLREEGRWLSSIGEWGELMRERGNPHPRGQPRDPNQLYRSLGSFLWRETHYPGGAPKTDGILVEADGKVGLREWLEDTAA